MFRGSTVYVTTERIIVNKGKGQLQLGRHFLIALLVGAAPFVPTIAALLILFIVATVIIFPLLKRKVSRRKWPTIDFVETGRRQFMVRKTELLKIDMIQPTKFRKGQFTITSTSTEPFTLKVLGGKPFKVASSLLRQFQAPRTGMTDWPAT